MKLMKACDKYDLAVADVTEADGFQVLQISPTDPEGIPDLLTLGLQHRLSRWLAAAQDPGPAPDPLHVARETVGDEGAATAWIA
jgi:hypothetical protein